MKNAENNKRNKPRQQRYVYTNIVSKTPIVAQSKQKLSIADGATIADNRTVYLGSSDYIRYHFSRVHETKSSNISEPVLDDTRHRDKDIVSSARFSFLCRERANVRESSNTPN